MFYALTIFVIFFTMIAWKVAVDELVSLREDAPSQAKIEKVSESSKI
ncbi:MAG TPA: hypothetical protein VFM59_03600 [Salinimicrobium sp.]|nr:hypothetical protein [Salinimicrobium sp.]